MFYQKAYPFGTYWFPGQIRRTSDNFLPILRNSPVVRPFPNGRKDQKHHSCSNMNKYKVFVYFRYIQEDLHYHLPDTDFLPNYRIENHKWNNIPNNNRSVKPLYWDLLYSAELQHDPMHLSYQDADQTDL